MPRLLFVGDIHLGRRPSRLPEDLGGLRPADLGPAAAWRATVDLALAEQVDAVVLAGDVVDALDDRFEAFGHLQGGVRRLVDAGVPVLGVAGNHDVTALPRLADLVPGFRLLGAGGAWEHVDVAGADGRRVRLLGWSFPAVRHARDPLQGLEVPREPGVPVLGVLHCELDGAPGSPYAPVSAAELAARPIDAWFLGHVHRPGTLSGPRPLGYLGSLVGLDPGEPGARGPWLVEVEGPGAVRARHPLAPLRYERVEVDVSGLQPAGREDPAEALESAVVRALQEAGARCDEDGAQASWVACRVVLRGRTPHHETLARVLARADFEALRLPQPGRTLAVESIVDEAQADLDLEALARGTSPPALLAQRLLLLERGGPDAEALVRRALPRLRRAAGDRAFAGLDADPPSDEAARQVLLRAGRTALEHLLAEGGAA